jgi:CDP-diacylglycerol--glycerol-3-phosphate 3-phosphatidyltransferase
MYWAAQPLGRALVRARISANAITLAALPLALLAAFAFAEQHYGVGALFAALCFACDGLDGLVARATGTAGEAGKVLDTVCDRISEALMFGGLAMGWRAAPWLLGLVLVAALGAQLVTLASARAEAAPEVLVPRGAMRRAERAVYLVAGGALSGVLQDVQPSALLAVAPLGVALALIGLVGNGSALHRFSVLARGLGRPRDVRKPSSDSERVHQDAAE